MAYTCPVIRSQRQADAEARHGHRIEPKTAETLPDINGAKDDYIVSLSLQHNSA
jgi:hypothetical protein